MVNPTKYDDFVQTGVNGTHTLFKCPVAGCVNPTVQVPRADPRQKSSRCFKHNSKYHSKSSNVALVINACCEESRRPLEDRIDAIREEQRLERVEAERRHEQAERRHQELVEEFRASQRTLNGFVSMVAHELKITPPDVVTVSVKLPKTLECHNRRMNDLQSSNQVFSSRLQAAEKENTKLKRKLAELQRRPPDVRVEVKESAIDAAMRAFCKNTNGKKRMRTALHPDKFSHLPKDTQKELEAAAQTIRRVIGL